MKQFSNTLLIRYGDRAPITILGRFLAIAVILSGLVIFGIVNGYMATSISSVALETDYKIYGAKVGQYSNGRGQNSVKGNKVCPLFDQNHC